MMNYNKWRNNFNFKNNNNKVYNKVYYKKIDKIKNNYHYQNKLIII